MRLVLGRRALAVLALGAAALPAAAQTPVQKLQLVAPETLQALAWHSLATDPRGDGLRPRLPDAKELAYALDAKAGVVWFKVACHDVLPERFFGINVAADNDNVPDNGLTWWGTNKFKLDRLASAYLFQADGYWQGAAGVSDGESAGRYLFNSLTRDTRAAVDREHKTLFLGVPRAALGPATSVRVIATVGSMMVNNDDVPNEGSVVVPLEP